MSFFTKRGRPKKVFTEKDNGTQELRAKKLAFVTEEPLDICYHKSVITPLEHKAGLHLRWLHSLRFGITNITANTSFLRGKNIREEDSIWREAREEEYKNALDLLIKTKSKQAVISLCIYNEMPKFLFIKDCTLKNLQKNSFYGDYIKIHDGLDSLVGLWFSAPTNKF